MLSFLYFLQEAVVVGSHLSDDAGKLAPAVSQGGELSTPRHINFIQ